MNKLERIDGVSIELERTEPMLLNEYRYPEQVCGNGYIVSKLLGPVIFGKVWRIKLGKKRYWEAEGPDGIHYRPFRSRIKSVKFLIERWKDIRKRGCGNGIRDWVTIDQTIQLLNEALEADPEAIRKLVGTRVQCRRELADHPTIQVMVDSESVLYHVGLLGVLNGLFGIRSDDGFGAIHAECKSDGTIIAFARTTDARPIREKA